MKVGIDSALPIYATVPGTSLSIVEDTKAWLGRYPDFWIRPTGTGGKAASPLTQNEISQILKDGMGVFPYYNDSPLNDGSTEGTYALGVQDAQNALSQYRALGLPTLLPPACDIESNAKVNAAWVHGWADTMRPSPYALSGMLYGNLGPNMALGQAVLQALKEDQNGNVGRILLWDAFWKYKQGLDYQNAATVAWQPISPSSQTLPMVRMWQLSGGDFGGIGDEDVCTEAFFATCVMREQNPPKVSLPPGWQNSGGQAATPGGLTFRELVKGSRNGEAFQIPYTLSGPNGSKALVSTLDTGDFELMVSPEVATELGIPQDQTLTVEGVTGNEQAYYSGVTIQIGNLTFQNVQCFVAASQAGMLVGLRMFWNRGIGFRFDPTTATLELYGAP